MVDSREGGNSDHQYHLKAPFKRICSPQLNGFGLATPSLCRKYKKTTDFRRSRIDACLSQRQKMRKAVLD